MLDIESLRRFAAALDANLDVERCAPPLAHWAYFLDIVSATQIGSDGHCSRDRGILPPVRLPRRMFAGAAMQFCRPLSIGIAAELTLSLVGIKHRVNSGGDLVFVEIDRRLSQDGDIRVVEKQTIVYRAGFSAVPTVANNTRRNCDNEEIWSPSPVDLFRFSAATFNSHRIHYDAAYAREQEGYPSLVVQGPFTAAKLFDFVQRREGPVSRFSFRATAPLFVDQEVRLVGGPVAGEVQAIRCDGVLAMSARAG